MERLQELRRPADRAEELGGRLDHGNRSLRQPPPRDGDRESSDSGIGWIQRRPGLSCGPGEAVEPVAGNRGVGLT
ncbi:MAG: hypothetical protein M3381_12445 [Actinomycetota bacterium]|nr:hypothetical protein [Actinomycetota bacterium]